MAVTSIQQALFEHGWFMIERYGICIVCGKRVPRHLPHTCNRSNTMTDKQTDKTTPAYDMSDKQLISNTEAMRIKYMRLANIVWPEVKDEAFAIADLEERAKLAVAKAALYDSAKSGTLAPAYDITDNQMAQFMYHAYGLTTDFKNYQGLPMPAWEALPVAITKAWEAAAAEAKRICLGTDVYPV